MTVAADAHVARRDAYDLSFLTVQKLRRRKPWIDLNAKGLGARAEPACDCAERADEIAVIAHQLWHRPIRQSHSMLLSQVVELIRCNLES